MSSRTDKTGISKLFSHSKTIGQGMYGTVKLLDPTDPTVMKHTSNLGLPQNKSLVLKRFTRAKNKQAEVEAHTEIWRRIRAGRSNTCSRFIAQPYPLDHPTISVQNSAIPRGYRGMTLDEFLENEIKNVNQNLRAKIKSVLMKEIVQALACLHNHGVVHSDVKLDNFMVYYQPESILKIRVKIIDMGLAVLNNENKPLMKFTKTNDASYLNTNKLQQLLEYGHSQVFPSEDENNKLGLFANSIILPWRDSFKKFNRRVYNDPNLKGRTSYVENALSKHFSNKHYVSRRDGSVRVQNATQDLYKLEDNQAKRVQATTREFLNRKRVQKVRNAAKPVRKESVKRFQISRASAASRKTNENPLSIESILLMLQAPWTRAKIMM
jgi:serine/threonine protein kinase